VQPASAEDDVAGPVTQLHLPDLACCPVIMCGAPRSGAAFRT
jgi:hypothetical protein